MATNNALNASIPFALSNGGTGTSLTAINGGVVYSNGSSLAISSALTNGQLLIGSTGSTPVPANLIAGAGIAISNGAGSITISSSSFVSNWIVVTGTSQTIVVGNSYIANNASLITFTLPTTSNVGDEFSIVGLGAGGWKIAQNASQSIRIGSLASTAGVGGSINSTNQYDSVSFVCIVANTTWIQSAAPQGNINIV